jgi:uncharacterized integral membrane protein
MSSTGERPQVQVQRDRRPEDGGYGKLIVAAVIAVLLLIFVFSNTTKWEFNFLFLGPYKLWAWLMLLITLFFGFLIGMIVSALLRRRKKRELKRRAATY